MRIAWIGHIGSQSGDLRIRDLQWNLLKTEVDRRTGTLDISIPFPGDVCMIGYLQMTANNSGPSKIISYLVDQVADGFPVPDHQFPKLILAKKGDQSELDPAYRHEHLPSGLYTAIQYELKFFEVPPYHRCVFTTNIFIRIVLFPVMSRRRGYLASETLRQQLFLHPHGIGQFHTAVILLIRHLPPAKKRQD